MTGARNFRTDAALITRITARETDMLRNILFAVGIGYLFRRFSGGRRVGRGYGTRW